MSSLQTGFAIAITACALVGLVLASRVLEGPEKRRKQFFIYYTNLSNALMLLYHALLLCGGGVRRALLHPSVQLSMAVCVFVTFLIYFFVLTRFGRHHSSDPTKPFGVRRVSNVFVHYLVPLLTVAEWVLTAEKSALTAADALWWLVIPLAYVVFIILRARTGKIIENTGSLWPYGFIDREKLGVKRWLRNAALTSLGFYALGLLFVGTAKLLS